MPAIMVRVDVDKKVADEVAEYLVGKGWDADPVVIAQVMAQDIMDRYFDWEHLNVDDIPELLQLERVRGARRATGGLRATGEYDVMARVLLGTREAAGGALQPVYDILRDYIDRALGHLKREGLTVGIEDSELDLVVYVHGVDADSPRQAGELVFNQLKRDGAIVVAEVQPQV